jgi:protein ImuB
LNVGPHIEETQGRLPASAPLPRALVRGEGGGTRLVAIDRRARVEGVRIGMTVAEARARLPSLAIAMLDDARLDAMEARIVDALVTVSPRLGRTSQSAHAFGLRPSSAPHDDFLLDVASPADVDRLTELVRDLDLGPATIGVADGAFAAICAAHAIEPRIAEGDTPMPPRRKIVARGGDASFLAPLPSSFLPGAPSTIDALRALGLDTMGLVAALPLEGVQARLGEEGRFLVGLARGEPPPAVATYVPSDEPTTEVDLSDGEGDGALTLEPIVFALRAACLRLLPPLAARGHGAAEVELLLDARSGPTRIVIRPARPEIDPQALFELARATLEGTIRISPGDGFPPEGSPPSHAERTDAFDPVKRIRLTVTLLVPVDHTGERLAFARRDATVLPLDVTLARLRGRFGSERVVTPVRNEDPRPDGRGTFRTLGPSDPHVVSQRASSPPNPPTLRERLRAPSPSIGAVILSRAPIVGDPWPVRAIGSGDPRRRRVVREVSAPERIASGWWSEPFDLVYRWVIADDGARALFARANEGAAWRLVGVAD